MERLAPYLRSAAGLLLILGLVPLFWPQSLGGQVAYVMVSGTSMEPGMHDGDLVVVRSQRTYEVGDTVAYRIPEGDAGAGHLVIHRIVGGDGRTGYITQGDNRDGTDIWRPGDGDVVGAQWLHVPRVGGAVPWLRAPLPLAAGAAVVTVVLVLWPSPRSRRARSPQGQAAAV